MKRGDLTMSVMHSESIDRSDFYGSIHGNELNWPLPKPSNILIVFLPGVKAG